MAVDPSDILKRWPSRLFPKDLSGNLSPVDYWNSTLNGKRNYRGVCSSAGGQRWAS